MSRPSKIALAIVSSFLFFSGCGPATSDPGNTGGSDEPVPDPNGPGSLSGTVWAPANGPGSVPAGHEIPIAGAFVYITTTRPEPIPDRAYCQECEVVQKGVLSDDKGRFSIPNVVPGTYWFVVQKGQFRRETEIITAPNVDMPLTPAETTLPSNYDPDNGEWIPRVAIAPGSYDALEDILGKIGLGEISGSGTYQSSSAMGFLDVWANGGKIDDVAMGTLADLVSDLDTMLNYHIIFIPCGGSAHVAALENQDNLRNIREYVALGGKLYVTDWAGEWIDNVFPNQIELWNGSGSATIDTPADAYDAETDTWDPTKFGTSDGTPSYTSNSGETIDGPLTSWLDQQEGPMIEGGSGFYDANNLVVAENFNHIEKVNTVQVGMDDEGNPIFDEPKVWVVGDDGRPGGKKPLTVTYEPAGCGRVLYSTYHTTHEPHSGLVPQERILVYLIMEIGVCNEPPVFE